MSESFKKYLKDHELGSEKDWREEGEFWDMGRQSVLTELEKKIEELKATAKKHYVDTDDKEEEEYFDGRWRMAGEILTIIRSMKGSDK